MFEMHLDQGTKSYWKLMRPSASMIRAMF